MMRIAITAIAMVVAATFASAGESYKCVDSWGGITWQDFPCEDGMQASRSQMHDYSKEDASKKGHGKFTAAQASQLIRLRKVAIGMSKQDAIRSWGLPSKTVVSLTDRGRSEQLLYNNYAEAPVLVISRDEVIEIIYSKEKPKEAKPSKRLGEVNASGYGQYGAP